MAADVAGRELRGESSRRIQVEIKHRICLPGIHRQSLFQHPAPHLGQVQLFQHPVASVSAGSGRDTAVFVTIYW